MGLLDKLWDDVVAGPMPDRGLGRLRRPGGHHHHHQDVDHDGDNDMGRMLERRRSSDFRAEEEEARRMAEQIMNPASAIKKPPNLKLLRTESFPSDQTQGMSESASSTPRSPGSSSAGSTPHSAERLNVWRSVFNPGSNKAMEKIGSDKFDKAQPNSPTVYDWLYSGETKSSWR